MTDAAYTYGFSNLGFSQRIQDDYDQMVADFGFDTSFTSEQGLTYEPARVVKVDRGFPLVAAKSGSYRTELSSRMAKKARKDVLSRPAVGDWVVLSHPPDHEFGVVEAFLPRYSSLKRRDPVERKSAGYSAAQQATGQIVVSNIDIIFVVQALSTASCSVNLARMERELVLAYQSGARPMIVLTKADLCPDPEASARHAAQSAAGAPIIIESAVTGLGIAEIRRIIGPGVTASLLGASGVGKSTMINRLLGHERQYTLSTRESDDRGRHATVARELIELPLEQTDAGPSGGGVIIDTPGMRSLALWQADRGLELAFPEITEAAEGCKFGDCAHGNEPKCGVKAAVESGDIDEGRYLRYLSLYKELVEEGGLA